jgi:predicted AlkP superfamily phosphohydrolase/phosphomutase
MRMVLRTAGNAAIAAAVWAVGLATLTLYLNPELRLRDEGLALLVALVLPWTLVAALALGVVALAGTLLRWWSRPLGSLLPGRPWLGTFLVLATGGLAALYGYNLWSYRHSIPEDAVRALAASSLAVAIAALVLVAMSVDGLLFPRRTRGASGALAALAPAAALCVPLALRPGATPAAAPAERTVDRAPGGRRVLIVGVDGLDLAQVQDGVARGGLASFARLLRRGASGPLATLRPTEGPPVWTTILTGRLPRDHGVKSFSTYRLLGSPRRYDLLPKGVLVRFLERARLVSTRPVTSEARRVPALWSAVNACGLGAGLVRVWGTQPPERVQGFVLSPYFHLLPPARAAQSLHPVDLLAEVEARRVRPADVDPALLAELVEVPPRDPPDAPWRIALVDRALAPDLTYQRAGALLRAAYAPSLYVANLHGLDVAGHAFYRPAHPDEFGDVSPEEARRFGRVLPGYLGLVGQWLTELAQGLGPGDVLLVVSGHGLRPVPWWRRLVDGMLGDEDRSASHGGAPDGFLLAVGDGIRPGASLRTASVLDVAPTVLYLLGLPVARDMEGRVLAEIVDDAFARRHPVAVIPSYAAVAPAAGPAPGASAGDGEDLPPLPEEGS